MTDAGRRARLAQKAKPSRFITEISLADDFQCHRAVQIDIDGFVSHSHGAAAKLDRFPILTRHQLIVLKPLHGLFHCCRLDRIFGGRRLAGLKPVSKGLAEHAYRTEFHRSRKLTAAVRADMLCLRAHGASRPPDATSASQRAWISSSISAGSDTVRAISSRNRELYRLRKRWIRVLTAPKPTPNAFATSSYDGEPSPTLPRKTLRDSKSDVFPWTAY